ncbi:SusC/RagA family TonB-linked outer membrane protein [Longitalea luteola]|uniref:SusC/RagA family TonB-linked outer membrane protein n=1 Tax=Longitalea luteola TaxID=2812563 RepID=UPI00210235D7|nr:TonB-dependent receptor [Longitalea luteola]
MIAIRKLCFLLFILWSCLPYESAAQQRRISGKVFNSSNLPMPGVNVQVKGTNIGTFTDTKGFFALNVPETKPVLLVVSSVGYTTQEVDVTNATGDLTVTLVEVPTQLTDVVVVGYGTARKKDLTGSVASVGLQSVEKTPVFGTSQLLQGRVAGVQVTQTNSQPGSAFTVRIRGTNSISTSSDPLYVVDGYAGADITALNPNDIVSMDVLKDASATAIYGSRGANGVVMITTRRGAAGKKAITFDAYTGVQQVANKLEMMDAQQYARFVNEAAAKSSPVLPQPYTEDQINAMGKGTDWQDELFRNARISNYNLGFTGGNADSRYYLSMNYFSQDGIIIGSDYKRGTLRFNLDSKISEKLRVGLSSQVSYESQLQANVNTTGGSAGGTLLDALLSSPVTPVYDSTGAYTFRNGPQPYAIDVGNPVAAANLNSDKNKNTRIFANFFAEYEMIKGLKLRSSFGGEYRNFRNDVFRPSNSYLGAQTNGYAQVVTNNNYNWLTENTLTYDKVFNRTHSINAVAGVTYQEWKNASVTSTVTGLSTNNLFTDNLAIGTANNGSNTNKNVLASFLGRLNYRLLDRYLFTFTFRADASSRFGENNKWGYFPSGAFAWRVKEENFLKEVDAISDLKFRASYGATGNQELPSYLSIKQYTANSYVLNRTRVTGFSQNNLPNPDLSWESTKAFDAGFDLAILGNRVQITADYYDKKTTKLLFQVSLPTTSGFSTMTQNIGSVQNKGVELGINTINIDKEKLKWSTSFNISANRNKVLDLGDVPYQFTGNVSSNLFPGGGRFSSILQVGKPIGEFYGYVFDGIWQSQADITKSGTKQSVKPGDPIYRDLNGDSALDATNDRTIIGHALPKFTYGFTSNLTVGRFNLFVLIQGVQGVDILNENKIEMENGLVFANKFAYVADQSWRGEGTSNTLPSVVSTYRRNLGVTSDLIENGSYLRFKTITLTYDLPLPKVSPIFKSASLYATGQNLITITDYSGYDPEVNSYSNTQGNYTSLNVDYNPYPNIKTYTVGLRLGF